MDTNALDIVIKLQLEARLLKFTSKLCTILLETEEL